MKHTADPVCSSHLGEGLEEKVSESLMKPVAKKIVFMYTYRGQNINIYLQ